MDNFKNISSYWERLKNRKSYQEGILGFTDHKEILKEAFPKNFNPHLNKLKNLIEEKNIN